MRSVMDLAFRRLERCALDNGWGNSLSVMFDGDVERAAGWTGEPGQLVVGLVGAEYLTGKPGAYMLCRPWLRLRLVPAGHTGASGSAHSSAHEKNTSPSDMLHARREGLSHGD